MLITLKQKEIEAALSLYINSRGISLLDKSVEIAFTAGRGQTGISAEVDIEDSTLSNKPLGKVTTFPANLNAPIVAQTSQAAAVVAVSSEAPAEAPVAAPSEAAGAEAKGVSLFA